MKRLISIVLTLISLNSFSQNIELTKDELPIYQGVVPVIGKDQKEIYGLLKVWVAKNYKSAINVIQVDDPDNGRLIIKGLDNYIIEVLAIKVENVCYHTITFETKPEKFRFSIEITEVTTGTEGQPMLHNVLLSDPPIKPNGKQYSGLMLNGILKQKEQHLTHISSMKNGLIRSLTNISTTKKDDW